MQTRVIVIDQYDNETVLEPPTGMTTPVLYYDDANDTVEWADLDDLSVGDVIWRPLMAQDPGTGIYQVVTDSGGSAIMVR